MFFTKRGAGGTIIFGAKNDAQKKAPYHAIWSLIPCYLKLVKEGKQDETKPVYNSCNL